MFIPLLNCFPNRFFRILRFPALIFISLLFVLMSNTVAYSRLATFSLDPNTKSYPDGYRVYILASKGYTSIGNVTFEKEECKLENNIVIFNLDLNLDFNQTNCFSVTAFKDGQESIFSEAYCISSARAGDSSARAGVSYESAGVSYDSDGDSIDSDGDGILDNIEINLGTDPQDPDSDDDGIGDGRELELGKDPLCPDATVEYSVQVTLDPELHFISIPDPRGYDVFYDTVSRWDGDCDDYKFSKEVGIANCRLDGKFVTCDLKIEFKPGETYFLSIKAFDNLYESTFSNEISFTLPEDADFDGIPDIGERRLLD